MPRTALGAAAAVAVVAASFVAAVPGAAAATLQRIEGPDRYGTAAQVSASEFPDGAAEVFVATGEAFPDALSAGAAAVALGGPVLLTRRDGLPPATADELDRLDPERVYVIGGAQAVSAPVEADLTVRTGATVERVSGSDRFATAAEVATRFFDAEVPVVHVASGENFPDALVAGAAAGASGGPVLLVRRDDVPGSAREAIDELQPEGVVVVGGEAVVSEAVRESLDATRLAGIDRYETAVRVAESTAGASEPVAFVATGEAFADALAGGVVAARRGQPLVLTRPACMPPVVLAVLEGWGAETRVVLGGSAAVSDASAQGASCSAAPELTVDTVASGLNIPWDIAFAPDGAMLITERGGNVRVLAGGQLGLVGRVANVAASGEGGLLGMALAPDFASSRLAFLCHNTASDVRLVRYRIAEDYSSLTHAGDVVTGMPTSGGRHSGCRPRFGPDGALWVGSGDAAQGTNPQNLGSLGGKVLRVDPQTGGGAPGNLTGRIYTYGHRNVQGLAFRPGSGQPFSAEHGPDRDDEINGLLAGGNYGRDPVPGYNESVPMTDKSKYPDAVDAVWSSGSPTVATSGLDFLSGSQWRGWDGALAVACLRGARLLVMQLNEAGDAIVGEETILSGTFGRLRTPMQGPDGFLYVTTSNGGGNDVIIRIRPS